MQIEVRVTIGRMTLEPAQRDGYVWMSWSDDGEGMEVEESKLAAWLEEFYRENF